MLLWFLHYSQSFLVEVILGGAMVRIKDGKYSASSIPFDIAFDKYLSVQVVLVDAELVTAAALVTPLADLVKSGKVGDTVGIFLKAEDKVSILAKSGRSFEKMAIHACDASTGTRFELVIIGDLVSDVEKLLAALNAGDSFRLRCAVVEHFGNGWRVGLRRGGAFTPNSGSEQEHCFFGLATIHDKSIFYDLLCL